MRNWWLTRFRRFVPVLVHAGIVCELAGPGEEFKAVVPLSGELAPREWPAAEACRNGRRRGQQPLVIRGFVRQRDRGIGRCRRLAPSEMAGLFHAPARRIAGMEIKPLEVYSEVSNFGIVRMPDRKFPGCVIPGDSLAILCRHAQSIVARLEAGLDSELQDDAVELLDSLQSRLRHYEGVLAQHGLSLPYSPTEPD